MKYFKYILAAFIGMALVVPFIASATSAVGWSITNLTDGAIFPNLVNGNAKGILVSASSTINGNFSVSGLTSGNCVQASTGGLLTTTGSACGSGGGGGSVGNWFTPQTYGNSTSTVIGFLLGMFSNGSTTVSSLGSGTVDANNGLLYGTATSSITNGTGISFGGTAGALIGGTSLTITNTGVTSNVAGTGISVSGATGAVTVTNTGVVTLGNGTGTTCSGTNPGTCNVNTTQNITTLSNLGSGTVNTASGVLYNTATSTPTVNAPITYSGTLGQFISGVSGAFGCTNASSGVTGCLTGTDWNTFNGKQTAGNYITALTGDVTATGPGSVAATLATVNGNIGSFTNTNLTVNAKGLITAASNGFSYPFPGGSTSTPVTFVNSLVSNGSTTITSVGSGEVASNNGLLYGTATTTVSCAGTVSCTSFPTFGTSPFTITGSGSGGGSFPFSVDNTYGQVVYSTSTPTLWFKSGLFSSSTVYIGAGGVGSSSVQYGSSGFEWTVGSLGTDNTFRIASGTALTPNSAITIDKTLKTTLVHASSTDISSNSIAIGGTGTTSISTAGALTVQSLTGLLKATSGLVTTATAGTDYDVFAYPFTPSTFGIGVSATTTPILDYAGLIAATSTFGTIVASSSITDQPLATAAGTFIAADPTGKLIATSSPSGSNSAFSPAANYASVAGLPSYTSSGGVITEVGTGALSVDGNNPTVGQIVLIKNESGACTSSAGTCQNGLYNVTAAGSGIAAFVLTRNSNYNSSSNVIPGIVTYVISGATLADDFWALTTPSPITVGTTGLTYVEVSGGGSSVLSVSIATANGFSGSSSGGTAPALTINATPVGILKSNGTTISAATPGTDYDTFAWPWTPGASTFGSAANSTSTTILFTQGISASTTSHFSTTTAFAGLFGTATTTKQVGGGSEAIGIQQPNVNSTAIYSAQTNQADAEWLVQVNGLMGWGAGGANDQDINFYRSGAGALTIQSATTNSTDAFRVNQASGGTGTAILDVNTTSGYVSTPQLLVNGAGGGAKVDVFGNGTTAIRAQTSASTDVAFASFVTGDAQLRFTFLGDGTMRWGTGATVTDTGLSRLSAGVLSVGNGNQGDYSGGFLSATSTFGALTATSSLKLSFITGTQCLHTINGVTSGTGSDCGSGGGGAAYPFTPSVFGATAVSATGTALQLTGGLFASSTVQFGNAAVSPFFFNGANGNLGLGTTSPWARFTIDRSGNSSQALASSSILVTEFAISTTTNKTIDARDSNSQLFQIGSSATTITLTGFLSGSQMKLMVCNPNATAGTITWATVPANILQWAGGVAPTQTTTANHCDLYSFFGTQATSSTNGSLSKIFGNQNTF